MKTFTMLVRPPALLITKTCIYKSTGETRIPIDVYLPVAPDVACPIMLFIHGGGWLAGSRSDYCRPLFQHFLSLGFICTSIDYRLLPETSLGGQLEDIRDAEPWLRNSLPTIFTDRGVTVNADKIVVVGASAGAHLALMTADSWREKPTAILSMYGPTNMHNVPSLGMSRFSNFPPPPPTPELLTAATFKAPPTEFSPPKHMKDYMRARSRMGERIFGAGLIAEFLIRGLQKDETGKPKLPEKGSVSEEEVNVISPLQLSQHVDYPPVCQVMGDADGVFDASHVHDFHEALEQRGVKCKKIIVSGKGHAFDIWGELEVK